MTTKFLNLSTDTTLGGVSPSDEIAVSQKAIKTYVDNQGGGGSSTLAGLSDVTLTSPTDGQVLTYDNGDWVNADSAGGYHPDLFDWKWADHICNDVQWLRADTFSWQSGAVYQAAYQHLVDDIDGKTLQSETIGGTTIQFYLADDGHKICPAGQESNVTAIYNATGVAWYYILDTVNQRFRLPRTQFGVTGLRDAVGNYVEAGLPDHSHTVGIPINSGWNGTARLGGSDMNSVQTTKTFTSANASASNSIYGNSTTVQPPATQMYLYFYVGNFTQTALENTAGITTETLNDKLDLDAGNATSTTKTTVIAWGIPDFSRATTLVVSTTPTLAPQNMYVWGALPGNGYFDVNTSNTYSDTDFNRRFGNLSTWSTGNCIVPKGCYYYANTTTGSLYWCPLKGE